MKEKNQKEHLMQISYKLKFLHIKLNSKKQPIHIKNAEILKKLFNYLQNLNNSIWQKDSIFTQATLFRA